MVRATTSLPRTHTHSSHSIEHFRSLAAISGRKVEGRWGVASPLRGAAPFPGGEETADASGAGTEEIPDIFSESHRSTATRKALCCINL